MILSKEENDILEGKQGPVLQKVMQTLVLYGKALDAERLVDIEGDGHFSISGSTPGIDAPIELLEELVEVGLTTKHPFTLDPRDPLDFHNLNINKAQAEEFKRMFINNGRYQKAMKKLGLKNHHAYTCSPYVFEQGNIPQKGDILAWSESSCVIYANSALGARTNRNAAILDLLSNIAGKTPLFGLIKDQGRKANWLIEVQTEQLPHPQLLGAIIGQTVQDGIPYITGLDRFFPKNDSEKIRDYLKEMGAACAAIGAVALYHIENITPEALENGRKLLKTEHKFLPIDDQDLNQLLSSYPIMWDDPDAPPQRAMIGCPHLSLRELHEWTDLICSALNRNQCEKVAIDTVLVAPPNVLREFRHDSKDVFEKLSATEVRLSATCLEAFMNNSLCASEAVITNSNKLRAFTNARLLLDIQLAEVIATGKIQETNPGNLGFEKEKKNEALTNELPIKMRSQAMTFQGRPLFFGEVQGKAIVSKKGFNSLACFYDTIRKESDQAICGDHDSEELFGKNLTGAILCIPRSIGSTSAGAVWELIARRNLAPAALLFSEKIDSLAAAGLALAEVWAEKRIPAIDNLGVDFLNYVKEGDSVKVRKDGQVFISKEGD